MVSDSELKALAEEGWTTRVKIVKKHKYIVIRRKGKDRSLGPFNEELYDKLKNLGMVKAKAKTDYSNEIIEIKEKIQNLSNRLDDICVLLPKTVYGKKFWLFTKIGHFTKSINALKRHVKKIEDEKIPNILKEHETRLTQNNWDIYNLKNDVKKLDRNIPITTLYDNYKCSKCGSIHLVSVNIHCTKCGFESWWGWNPKK